MSEVFVEIRNLAKSFNKDKVLDGVDLSIYTCSIHGLYGLNGAGKTTLINILSGIMRADSGVILVHGIPVNFSSPLDAKKIGFAAIYQNFDIAPNITVAEYAHMSTSVLKSGEFKFFSLKKMNTACQKLIDEYSLGCEPTDRISTLSAGQRQMLQIVVALSLNPKFIMLDEPFSKLTIFESTKLSNIFSLLKDNGVAILIVTHNITVLKNLCDEVTVLDNGHFSAHYTANTAEIDKWLSSFDRNGSIYSYPYIPKSFSRTLLSVHDISTNGMLKNVSFQLQKGEVLGVAGLLEGGQTSLSHALFGIERITNGELLLNGEKLKLRSPSDAIKHKISLITNDTFSEGLIATFQVSNNISLSNLPEVAPSNLISKTKENGIARRYIKQFAIKTPSIYEPTGNLSAGNQQKVNIVKWLFTNSSMLIMNDPTQSLDMSTKVEIYNFMNKFTLEGGGILFITSDFDELFGMSDRIIVMKKGHITETLLREAFSEKNLIKLLSTD